MNYEPASYQELQKKETSVEGEIMLRRKINPEFCKQSVFSGGWPYQCSRKSKVDGYCKQHHPETVKKKQDDWNKNWEREKLEVDAWRENKRLDEYNRIKAEILDGKTLIGPCGDCTYYNKTQPEQYAMKRGCMLAWPGHALRNVDLPGNFGCIHYLEKQS